MERRLWLFLALLLGFAVVAGLAIQEEKSSTQDGYKRALEAYRELTNRPPGLFGANWIPLTTNVGIALKPTRSPGPKGNPAFVEYSGTLMYRPTPGSSWQILMLDNPVRQIPVLNNPAK